MHIIITMFSGKKQLQHSPSLPQLLKPTLPCHCHSTLEEEWTLPQLITAMTTAKYGDGFGSLVLTEGVDGCGLFLFQLLFLQLLLDVMMTLSRRIRSW